jgi:hypothetical protein
MPAINLTDNTDLNLAATSADDNATLNRYLESLITFKTPPSLEPIANLLVKDQNELAFPIKLSATGEGKFAVKKTTLDVQLGASAALGLMQDINEATFLSDLQIGGEATSSGLVSFALSGTMVVGDDATAGDFTFGIAHTTTLTLTSYYAAAADETLGSAVTKAVAALTIPHDTTDLKSMPAGAICALDASNSLKFCASLTYNFLNDPLAAASIANLPSLGLAASASATIEATATHTSDHTLTVAKLPSGLLHLSVSLTKTDDLETSLTVSSGVAANIGGQDALAFLLDRINPNSAAEAEDIAKQMKDSEQFKSDIKSAIDAALSASLAISLKAALDRSVARTRAFLYEIDLGALDTDSKAALESALTGDFTAITKSGAPLAGIKELDSALTVTKTITHTFALHFLGIFNSASVNQFIAKSTVDFTTDTHELVLSDESIQVVDNNLDGEKLRKLVLKDMTLTLPASANTPDVKTPINLVFLDREGATSPSKMRQFVNALETLGASDVAAAQALLTRNLNNYGVCSLFLALNLTPSQCKQLFIGADNEPHDSSFYIAQLCTAQKTILNGLGNDGVSANRLRLFNADQDTWNNLQEAGAPPNITRILQNDLGMSDAQAKFALTDVITAVWWAHAMAAYAKALSKGQPLDKVGKAVVQDANLGYNEPWMVLASWKMAGQPAIEAKFISSIGAPPALAAKQSHS